MDLKKLIEEMDKIIKDKEVAEEKVRLDPKCRNNNKESVEEDEGVYRHKGTYGTSFDPDAPPAPAPAVKRGRGRPRKDADATGHVPQWDTATLQRWIVGTKPSTLPGKPGVKHKLKDWIDYVEGVSANKNLLTEGRMGEVSMLLADLAEGNADIYDVMNHPKDPVEKYVSRILKNMYDSIVQDGHLHPDDDHEKIIDLIADRLQRGEDLNEVSLDASQIALPQIKAPGAPAAQSSPATGTQAQAATTPAATGAKPAGIAVLDFKNQSDPLKQAMVQAVKNKQVSVLATEEVLKESSDDTAAERLSAILKNYPMEHRMAQEGWGIHEALYQSLCDHYWEHGKIPRDVMYGPSEKLRDWIEECYATDTQELMENPLLAAAANGLGVGVGSAVADKMLGDDVSM